MFKKYISPFLFFGLIAVFVCGCKKEDPHVAGNNQPYYGDVPTILLENYVTRIYIDLLGRKPIDNEMVREVEILRANNLSEKSRESIALRLQTDTSFVDGDSSYFIAYSHRFYDSCKGHVLDAATEDEINKTKGEILFQYQSDSLSGDSLHMQFTLKSIKRIRALQNCEWDYRNKKIDLHEVMSRMIYNPIYDIINNNTFNFIRATFDNLLYRFPTEAEYKAAYAMIEFNQSALLFGQPGENKGQYVEILTNSREFYEGVIVWVYQSLLSRDPSSAELSNNMATFFIDHNLQRLQRSIIKSNEYAHFKSL